MLVIGRVVTPIYHWERSAFRCQLHLRYFSLIVAFFYARIDLPRYSIRWNNMSDALDLRVKRPIRAVPDTEWTWPSEAAAIASMINTSGLQEKTVAIEAEIDASTLAKVKQGSARPSAEHLDRMMDATGSEAWLYFWLLRRGYDPKSLRKLESETERHLREARELLEAEKVKVRVLTDALRGVTS